MAGVLLYTGAPDSEGTLGGLVALSEPSRLAAVLRDALDRAKLCSTDPCVPTTMLAISATRSTTPPAMHASSRPRHPAKPATVTSIVQQ